MQIQGAYQCGSCFCIPANQMAQLSHSTKENELSSFYTEATET